MADTYQLSFTAEEIDERLAKAGNALLVTEQVLTEEQKAQVRANIGAGALPAIELADVPSLGDIVTLTEQEAQQVQAALAAGSYCIFYLAELYQCVVARKVDGADIFMGVVTHPSLPSGTGLLVVGTEDGVTYVSTWANL